MMSLFLVFCRAGNKKSGNNEISLIQVTVLNIHLNSGGCILADNNNTNALNKLTEIIVSQFE